MDFTKYHFLFNAACYFDAMEKYPDGFFELVMGNGKESLKALCWILQEMSEQAEAFRSYMGYERGEVFNADEALVKMRPLDIANARAVVVYATDVGMHGKGGEDEEELDLVLVELQKKTRPQD